MADQNNPHFPAIYRFIFFTTILVFIYCAAVTFVEVPEKNTRVVDTITGFLLGTVLASGIGYLLGGNPVASHSQNKINNVENIEVKQDEKRKD